jgi:hypothetical protein
MADSIVGGLFGMTPEIYQQQESQQALSQAAQLAQLDPMARARTGIMYGANRLVGALGGQDPMLQKITAQDQILKSLDITNPQSIATGIQRAQQAGIPELAFKLVAVRDEATARQQRQLAAQRQALVEQISMQGYQPAQPAIPEQQDLQETDALRYGSAAVPASYDISRVAPQLMALGTEGVAKLTSAKAAQKALLPETQTVKEGETIYERLPNGQYRPLISGQPKKEEPASMVKEYQFAKTADGGGFRGTYQEFVTARALAGRAPAQPRPEQPPVPVVDPKTGKVILVSREEAIANRLTPATAIEGLSPKEIQNREAKFPQAKTAVASFETSAEKLAKDLETLANSKGLEGITGLIGGRTPAITKEARAAEALYNSIVARGGFNELQNIRASSPTGGALGNVSNAEGQNLRDAFAPLKLTQNASDLKGQLLKAAQETRASIGRIKETFDMTYEYKTQGGQQSGQVGAKADPLGIR